MHLWPSRQLPSLGEGASLEQSVGFLTPICYNFVYSRSRVTKNVLRLKTISFLSQYLSIQ